jgi:hypothetical protein
MMNMMLYEFDTLEAFVHKLKMDKIMEANMTLREKRWFPNLKEGEQPKEGDKEALAVFAILTAEGKERIYQFSISIYAGLIDEEAVKKQVAENRDMIVQYIQKNHDGCIITPDTMVSPFKQ